MRVNCSWWVRWYHRRLRRMDRQVMGDSMMRAIARYRDPTPKETFAKMWNQFICERGQEHWLCPCANREVANAR